MLGCPHTSETPTLRLLVPYSLLLQHRLRHAFSSSVLSDLPANQPRLQRHAIPDHPFAYAVFECPLRCQLFPHQSAPRQVKNLGEFHDK